MIFVRLSASWAPLWTHLRLTPSFNMSFMDLAVNWVLNSEHCGGAVLVTKSNSDLQSVAATDSGRLCDLTVAVEYDSGSCFSVSVGACHLIFGSSNHAQHNLIQESWSKTDPSDTVSAARVLVTTLWIFLQPHDKGLTGHVTFLLISLWVLIMMQPVCESGVFFDANEASEKAKNRRSLTGIGWIVMETSLNRLASWRAWLALTRVATVALLMADWRKLSLDARSGRVWTEAYCRLPMRALRDCLSSSLTFSDSWVLRAWDSFMGSIFFTYSAWDILMLPSLLWVMWIPVKTKLLIFLDPNGYFVSNWSNLALNLSLPPQIPSSTCNPIMPSGLPVWGFRRMKTQGSNGEMPKPNRTSSSRIAQYHWYGASMRPYAPFSSLQTSLSFKPMAVANSFTGSIPKIRSVWGLPWRNAALISNDLRVHLLDASSWRSNNLLWRPRVGESRGISSICGSR